MPHANQGWRSALDSVLHKVPCDNSSLTGSVREQLIACDVKTEWLNWKLSLHKWKKMNNVILA